MKKERGYLEKLMNMSEEFEMEGEDMESRFGFQQGQSVWDLLSILGDIMGEGVSPESTTPSTGLKFEDFRAKIEE